MKVKLICSVQEIVTPPVMNQLEWLTQSQRIHNLYIRYNNYDLLSSKSYRNYDSFCIKLFHFADVLGFEIDYSRL